MVAMIVISCVTEAVYMPVKWVAALIIVLKYTVRALSRLTGAPASKWMERAGADVAPPRAGVLLVCDIREIRRSKAERPHHTGDLGAAAAAACPLVAPPPHRGN